MSEPTAKSEKTRSSAKLSLASPPMFGHEELDVYQLELHFIAWVTDFLAAVSGQATGKPAEACDQLDRASLSALLNTAEGNGKRQRQGRAEYFDDTRGSATECAACLNALVAKRAVSIDRILEGKKLLVRIDSMLCGLVDRFDVQGQLRDEAAGLDLNSAVQPVRYGATGTRTRMRTRRKN